MTVKQWLKDHKPVFKKTYNKALRLEAADRSKGIRAMEARHADELKEARKVASEIVSRLSNINYRKGFRHGEYTVCCNFSIEMMAHVNHDPTFLSYLAEDVSYRIKRHIVEAKFLHEHAGRISDY